MNNNLEIIKNEEELFDISGGINLTSSIITAIVQGAKIVLELGRSLGSAIKRSITGNVC